MVPSRVATVLNLLDTQMQYYAMHVILLLLLLFNHVANIGQVVIDSSLIGWAACNTVSVQAMAIR
jgi:hypothetical protein